LTLYTVSQAVLVFISWFYTADWQLLWMLLFASGLQSLAEYIGDKNRSWCNSDLLWPYVLWLSLLDGLLCVCYCFYMIGYSMINRLPQSDVKSNILYYSTFGILSRKFASFGS